MIVAIYLKKWLNKRISHPQTQTPPPVLMFVTYTTDGVPPIVSLSLLFECHRIITWANHYGRPIDAKSIILIIIIYFFQAFFRASLPSRASIPSFIWTQMQHVNKVHYGRNALSLDKITKKIHFFHDNNRVSVTIVRLSFVDSWMQRFVGGVTNQPYSVICHFVPPSPPTLSPNTRWES